MIIFCNETSSRLILQLLHFQNISAMVESAHTLSKADQGVFYSMVVAFISVGAYYGIKDRFFKKRSNRDFLTAASSHTVTSASISLFTSSLSSLTLIRLPMATYYFGPTYLLCFLHFFFAILCANYLTVPVFMRNGLNTTLEYLEKRFSRSVFHAALVFEIMETVLSTSLWMSYPVHSMSALTNFSFWPSLLICSGIATFYSSIGGMRAIILINWIHLTVICFANLSVIVKGTVTMGGIFQVLADNHVQGLGGEDRLYVDPDPNPFTDKSTTSTVIIGFFVFGLTNYSISQSVLHFYAPSATVVKAQLILWIQVPLMSVFYILCSFLGLVIYSFYKGCDPFLTNAIDRPDDIVQLFVLHVAGHLPGFVGLFLVSFLSGALSATAANLNGLSNVIHEHFVRKLLDKKNWKTSPTLITTLLGVVTLPFTFAAIVVNDILQGWIINFVTISNTFRCPVFGVFLLGLTNPRVRPVGALIGLVSGSIIGIYLLVSHYLYVAKLPPNAASVTNCPQFYCEQIGYQNNDTGCFSSDISMVSPITDQPPTSASFSSNDDIHWFHKLSYSMGGVICIVTTYVVGSIVSLFENPSAEEQKKNSKYLIACIGKRYEDKTEVTLTHDSLH